VYSRKMSTKQNAHMSSGLRRACNTWILVQKILSYNKIDVWYNTQISNNSIQKLSPSSFPFSVFALCSSSALD